MPTEPQEATFADIHLFFKCSLPISSLIPDRVCTNLTLPCSCTFVPCKCPPEDEGCEGYWTQCDALCSSSFVSGIPIPVGMHPQECPPGNFTTRMCLPGEGLCQMVTNSDLYISNSNSDSESRIMFWLIISVLIFCGIFGCVYLKTIQRHSSVERRLSTIMNDIKEGHTNRLPNATTNQVEGRSSYRSSLSVQNPPFMSRQISLSLSAKHATDNIDIQPVTAEIELIQRRVSRQLSDELQKQLEYDESSDDREPTHVRERNLTPEQRKHGESVYAEADEYLNFPDRKHRKTPSNSHTQSGTERSREYNSNPSLFQNLSLRTNPSTQTLEQSANSTSGNQTMDTLMSNGTKIPSNASSRNAENCTTTRSNEEDLFRMDMKRMDSAQLIAKLESVESEGDSDICDTNSDDSESAVLKAISPFLFDKHASDASHVSNPTARESTYLDYDNRPSLMPNPPSERRGSFIHPDSLQQFADRRRHSIVVTGRRQESIHRKSVRQKGKRERRSEMAQTLAAARKADKKAKVEKEMNARNARRPSFLGISLPLFGKAKQRWDSTSQSRSKQMKKKNENVNQPGGWSRHAPSRDRGRSEDNDTEASQTDDEIPPMTRASIESATDGPTYTSTGLNLRDAALSIKLSRAGSSTPRNDEAATKDLILSEHLFPTKNAARRRHTIGINSGSNKKKKKHKPKFVKTLSRNDGSAECSDDELMRQNWIGEQCEQSDNFSDDSDRSYSGLEIFHEAKTLSSKELWEIIARSRYVIERDDVEIDDQEQLGGGRFGKVYQADYNGATVAMKRVNVENQEGFIKECDVFFEVSTHPNICRYFGFSEINYIFYIVMEFFQNGSILHTMQKGHTFSLDQKVNICRQMSAGILHLHRKDVIHGDIAARNVLIDVRQMRVAVTDFGFSRKVGDTSKSRYISTRWAAPELTHEFIFTLSSDVYALGVTCMEVLQDGRNPFCGMTNTEVKRKVSSGMTPRIPEKWHEIIQEILLGCFTHRSDRLEVKHIYDGWKHYEQNFLESGFE